MEPKKLKLLMAVATISSLLIILPILWRLLGLSKIFFLVFGVSSAMIISILLWILTMHISVDHRTILNLRQSAEETRLEYSFLRRVAGLPGKIPYHVLEEATKNFQALIGRGSSGSVFKGILEDGTAVAVKQINGLEEQGDKEFQSEVSAIASVQHLNLIRLLGYCMLPKGGPRYLVYEYFSNGSLDKWIFQLNSGNRCLSWIQRYHVAIDVAKALSYLHHDCRARVLHLDVKPENILLNERFCAVVSDFGLSRIMKRDESRILMKVRGTRGYLAPEWLSGHGVTEKSDVYSFGMVLFELVGGRRNLLLDGNKASYFPKTVKERMREGRCMEVVDARMMVEEIKEKQVMDLINVGMWCVQEESGIRPSMARVVDMLEGRVRIDTPPDTEMVIVDVLGGFGLGVEEERVLGSSCSSFTTVLSGR